MEKFVRILIFSRNPTASCQYENNDKNHLTETSPKYLQPPKKRKILEQREVITTEISSGPEEEKALKDSNRAPNS